MYIPRTRDIATAMADAWATGVYTPELRAAFASRALKNARWYEAVATTVVIALMVLKPF